jgi:hypothetical protein
MTILNPCDLNFCNGRFPSTPRPWLGGSGTYGLGACLGIARQYQDPCSRRSGVVVR